MKANDRAENAVNAFDASPENIKQIVLELMAAFHMRNGVQHPDGSLGTIVISPKQFRDCLAYMTSISPGAKHNAV